MEDIKLEEEISKNKSQEIVLDPKKVLISITDTSGNIEYCNDEFVEVTGFDTVALVGSQHNLLRHTDMPSTLYKYIWQRLEKEEELTAIIKNNDKNRNYFWVIVDFIVRKDNNGKVIGYRANRKPAPKMAVNTIIPLYEKLIYLEDMTGVDLAFDFFNEYFERRKTNYDDFIKNIINPNILVEKDSSAKKDRFSSVRKFIKK